MTITTPAVVLSGIKYGESSLIVKALTRESGLNSYWVPGVYGKKKSRMHSSFFQPLSILEINGYHKNKGTLERMREVRPLYQFHSFSTDVRKVACALFISEVLLSSLEQDQQDEALYEYVERSIRWMDASDFSPLFPAYFLWNLTAYLGFFPDTSHRDFPLFHLSEGTFVLKGHPSQCLEGEGLKLFISLTECGLDELVGLSYGKGEPKEQLLWCIRYYEQQVQGFRSPRSLSVLKDVFA
jgi:DNA repair protein RecO (recombination protein O)